VRAFSKADNPTEIVILGEYADKGKAMQMFQSQEFRDATQRADIYSLGATIHHLLTRRDPRLEPPFSFGERPIRQINPLVSADLEAVVQTALQYNPDERFSDASEMKKALLAAAKKTGALDRIVVPNVSDDQTIKPLWVFRCEDEVRGSPAFDLGMIFVGSYDNNLYGIDAVNGEFRWKYPTEGGIVTKPFVADDLVFAGPAFLEPPGRKTHPEFTARGRRPCVFWRRRWLPALHQHHLHPPGVPV